MLIRYVETGELVTIRLNETGNTRLLIPGLIVGTRLDEKRTFYCVHAGGSTHWVTDNDLGPIELSVPRARTKTNS